MWGWLGIAMVFYVVAEYFSKQWGYKPSIQLALPVILGYMIGTICWLAILMYRNEIARMGLVWTTVMTILSLFVGIVIFREKMSLSQGIGAGLGVVGLYLMSR